MERIVSAVRGPQKILLADDDVVGRHLLERLFTARGHDVEVAADGREAWRILQGDDAPRIAILDGSMPGMDGLEVCRRVRAQFDRPSTYIVLLTAKGAAEGLDEAMEAGVDDCLSKPFRIEEIVARVRAGQRIIDLQSALLAAQEQGRVQAKHDALSGEWNRATILSMVGREVSRASRASTSVGIVLFEVDCFEAVNDTHGHEAGAAVIRQTVAHLKTTLRRYDAIGRYGAKELLVVAPGCAQADVWSIAERARLAVAESVMILHGSPLSVTVTCGAVATGGRGEVTAARLVTEAEVALDRARAAGPNRVELAFASVSLPASSGR